MKFWLSLLVLLLATPAAAQGPNPRPPIFGVHYTFERVVTERVVDDDKDKGVIRLVSHVYRPLAKTDGKVVVVLHGSTGGMAISPHESFLGAGPSNWYLMEKGYTVVIPMRRGRAESGGQYVEECAYQAGKCTLAGYRELMPAGLADALASTEAVVDDLVLKQLKPPGGRVLLWGGSRGAILALRYAAKHPEQVRGVMAVSPGWLSMVDKWPAEENRARMEMQSAEVAAAGRAYKGPTLWVYADGDPFYPEARTRELFAAFTAAGGSGRYVQVRNHGLANGHVPPESLWKADADAFLSNLPE